MIAKDAGPGLPKYGAVELKNAYRRNFTEALALVSLVHLLVTGGTRALERPARPPALPKPPRITVHDVRDLLPPPPFDPGSVIPTQVTMRAALRPGKGIPVPVPDAEVDPEKTLATQAEMNASDGPPAAEGEGGYALAEDFAVEPPPRDFVPFEREPVCIRRVAPVYPEMAVAAGIVGTVNAKLWIDRHGKVRQVVIVRSDNELFNRNVIDAAMTWVFTPAMMSNGPVDVWWAVPFHFYLR